MQGLTSEEKGFRLIVTGRAGTGRTVLVALLAHLFAMQGIEVLAVDADPEQGLAASLGLPLARQQYENAVEEQHTASTDTLLHLGPTISGTLESHVIRIAEHLNLCMTGDVEEIGHPGFEGAIHEFIRINQGVVLLDTLAGVEHLARAVKEGFSRALVVADPSQSALSVALRAATFARALGIGDIHLVVNQVCGETDLEEVGRAVGPCHLFTTITYLSYDEGVHQVWPTVTPLLREETAFMAGVRGICRVLSQIGQR
ncbi:MAG: carbon monoxide dehydrogenase [Methanofollis sp.]|nr:carbon monoxide dehydrogenase [Methanofollis sp.]